MARSPDPDEYRMSLGDHLEELRYRILMGLIGPVVGAVIALIFGKQILAFLVRPYLAAQYAFGHSAQIEALSYAEGFTEYLKVSLLVGLIIGLPWLLWQMWRFVETGLYESERRLAMALLPGSALLMMIGLAFLYYIMLPVVLAFMIGFASNIPMPQVHEGGWFNWVFARLVDSPQADYPENGADLPAANDSLSPGRLPVLRQAPLDPQEGQMWIKAPEQYLCVHVGGRTLTYLPTGSDALATRQRLNEYIRSVLWLALAFAVSFQLPVVMLLVNRSGLVTVRHLASARKYALLGCFVASAILTPADPISQVLLAAPMYLLYELGLLVVYWTGRQSRVKPT